MGLLFSMIYSILFFKSKNSSQSIIELVHYIYLQSIGYWKNNIWDVYHFINLRWIEIYIKELLFIALWHLVRTRRSKYCQQDSSTLSEQLCRLSVHHLWSTSASAIIAQLSLNFKTIIFKLQIACCEHCSHCHP